MSGHTVKQVAKLSRVSVRALHHYDEIGLLKPASVGTNGYRYYRREELLRLQQILFYRELGLALEDIRRLLDAPDFDRVAALKAHRAKLVADTQRYRQLVRTIDETLAALKGATTMDEKAMWKGFDPAKQAERETWLIEQFGEGVRPAIEASKARLAELTKGEFESLIADVEAIEAEIAAAMRAGLPAASASVQAAIRRHHAWVGRSWNADPDAGRYMGLAGMYGDHPEFRARYEERAAGLTEYLQAAMRSFAHAELT